MKNDIKIAIIQSDLIWENPEKNRESFSKKISTISTDIDLIILPEMFTSGFTMNAQTVAETTDGDTIHWLKTTATKVNAAIVGSLVILEDRKFYNRLVFVHPDGRIDTYDKRHTFTLAGEDKVYTAGKHKTIINYLGWRICPLICYDLRFPVWARNTEDYDLLLYVANWPKPRISAWDALLKARAIENMCYCVGVNRVGVDNTGHNYPGHSIVYDVLGRTIADSTEGADQIIETTLHHDAIKTYREKLNFLNDKDIFNLVV